MFSAGLHVVGLWNPVRGTCYCVRIIRASVERGSTVIFAPDIVKFACSKVKCPNFLFFGNNYDPNLLFFFQLFVFIVLFS